MLNKIIQYSLHNRLVVMIASIALLLWGSYTAHKMEVDVFPDLNAPTVVVMTEAQGMAPEEVERMVTFPIETAVNGATDVKSVRSSSTTGFSVVWVQFDWGTLIYDCFGFLYCHSTFKFFLSIFSCYHSFPRFSGGYHSSFPT